MKNGPSPFVHRVLPDPRRFRHRQTVAGIENNKQELNLRRVSPEKRKKQKMKAEQRIKLSAVTTTAVGLVGLVTLLLLAGLLPASAKDHDNNPQYVLQNFRVP